MRGTKRFIGTVLGSVGLAVLGGCQASSMTRVTVMNESSADLLVDVAFAGSDNFLYEAQPVNQSGVREFTVLHGGNETPVEVGVRAAEFTDAPSNWLSFDPLNGPYLLRVQGSAGNLRYLPTRDVPNVKADGVQPTHRGRLGAEPPVNPR